MLSVGDLMGRWIGYSWGFWDVEVFFVFDIFFINFIEEFCKIKGFWVWYDYIVLVES